MKLEKEFGLDEISNYKRGFLDCQDKVLKIINNPKSWIYIDNEKETITEEAMTALRNL